MGLVQMMGMGMVQMVGWRRWGWRIKRDNPYFVDDAHGT